MKTMMRSGKPILRGISLLLMMSLLITLLPAAASAETTPGAYGIVTVTTKNVVIRVTPGGTRTGYFAQPGEYAMIGPSIVDANGVTWYNIQTSRTSGYVHGDFATASYGGAGMPDTDKTYVMLLADTNIYEGSDAENPVSTVAVSVSADTILQLETGTPYSATVGGTTDTYINLYFDNKIYHTKYTDDFAKGILTTDNLNAYIAEVTWQSDTTSYFRNANAKGDFLTHAMQAALSLLEYYTDTVDGFYGANTSAAVKKFREDSGLTSSENSNNATFSKAFEQATDRLDYIRGNPGLGGNTGDGGGTTDPNTITTTVDKLRIRKSYTTSSSYLGMIEFKGTVLNYTRTQLNGSVTWYYIKYNGTYGWVMGTYVTESSSSSGGTSTEITDYGTVTITKKLVAIRTSANGSRSGYHVNTGDVCTMIGPAVEAGGYTWYNIRTEGGREGWVRGDCATADFGSAGMPDTEKKYVQILYDATLATEGTSPDDIQGGIVTLPKNAVLQLQTGLSYTNGGVAYINVYYDNTVYFTLYNDNLIEGLMTTDDLNKYIINTVWPTGLPTGEQAGETLSAITTLRTSDIYVHAIQAALFELGLYTDKVDGIFGSKTADAVKEYKNTYGKSPINEVISADDSVDLFIAGMAALQAKRTGSGTSGGEVNVVGDFGTVNTVKKGSWAEVDGGSRSLFPKGTTVTVMSVTTKKVFRVYRWSGANHADVVTYDTTDTAVLSSILGVSYNSSAPNSSELALIKASGNQDWPDYTWPKFRWAGATLANAYKIPVWVNLNGTVYCASMYVIPHGYTGTSSFSLSKRDGQYYYELNNMYGMMCLHFYGSTTHSSGVVDPTHASNINYAYNNAASYFGASKVE